MSCHKKYRLHEVFNPLCDDNKQTLTLWFKGPIYQLCIICILYKCKEMYSQV